MAKGVGTGKSSLLLLIIADAFIVGAIVTCALDTGRYHSLRDPRYEEALRFVLLDQTDKNQYDQIYNCACFASDFVDSSAKTGYRCGYVTIEFPDSGHAIVCFDTLDKGLVFIEPQSDEIVTLETGTPYLDRIVVRLSIYWADVSGSHTILMLSLIPLPLSIMATLQVAANFRKKCLSFSGR